MSDPTGVELGGALSRLLAVVVEREEPILAAQGLSMWEYVILGRLVDEEGLTQTALAERSRRDPTRLIANLDALEARGLVSRAIDPGDRRRRLVRLTDAGATAVAATRRAIRAMEDDLLSAVSAQDRDRLRATLARLVDAVA
ncbi:MarR family winged helix-turn-helix transcriptional regulator [Frondihabitans australicus]|uniref:DNA-binding MarR family transcriptional regulator n=1 Tax=Frondihabitans australicus TaxID=386892 RepID=A0A495IKX4_9MICO|nr:MarR family transcriptional regulator [Frondihabitans australicus]RKR75931.1 DNA-binding MarR family transcriptional regulator [Frondihabitans australicus]